MGQQPHTREAIDEIDENFSTVGPRNLAFKRCWFILFCIKWCIYFIIMYFNWLYLKEIMNKINLFNLFNLFLWKTFSKEFLSYPTYMYLENNVERHYLSEFLIWFLINKILFPYPCKFITSRVQCHGGLKIIFIDRKKIN